MGRKGVINVWWIGILIGVGFGLLIWFLIWYYKKHPEAKTEQWLEIANGISDIVGIVLKTIDKEPKVESTTERLYRYASLAVANVEQSFKKIKAEFIEEGGDISKLHQTMKDEAWRFIESLAEADNIPLTGAERGIISGIIEAALYFLPKPGEVVIIESEELDSSNTESGGDKEAPSDSPGT
jgi:hypothetical protein